VLEIAEREAIATSAGCLHSACPVCSSVAPQLTRCASVLVRMWRARGGVLVRVGSCGAVNGWGFGGLAPL